MTQTPSGPGAAPALSLLRRMWRRLPMSVRRRAGQALRALLGPAVAAHLPRAAATPAQAADQAMVAGVFSAALGHGGAARLLQQELRAAGVRVGALDVTAIVGADANDPRAIDSDDVDARAPLIIAVNPDTALVAFSGARAAMLEGRRVIGYFVWELELAPASWRALSPALHELWAPSRFAADAIAKRFERPVEVVPHPIAIAPPPAPTPEARARGRARVGSAAGDFVALSSFTVTSSLARKNPFGAIAAFEQAFGADPSKRLVLRCLGGHRFPEAQQRLRAAVRDSKATVTLIDAPGGLDELHDLYAACDVYLSLHRSEGFGMNLAEAMLCARPVIATDWSGNTEFMDASCAAMVRCSLVPIRDAQGIYGGRDLRWAEPSIPEAVAHLQRLASEPSHREALGAAAHARALAVLSGGAAAKALRSGAHAS